jgi:glucoamylase
MRPYRLIAAALLALPFSSAVMTAQALAPNGPGATPYWPRANKQGVGTSLTKTSHVWFTVGGGTLNEVFYPAVDKANTRDLELVVTDGRSFADFESIDTIHTIEYPDDSALILKQVNTAKSGRYKITKTYIADPARDVVLIKAELTVLTPGPALKAYVYYDPSLNNLGYHDTAYSDGSALVAIKRPEDMREEAARAKAEADAAAKAAAESVSGWSLTGAPGATPGDVASALIAQPAFTATSNGFFETSDGAADLKKHYALTHKYARAVNGNVVQMGELPASFGQGQPVTLALAFGDSAAAALAAGRASLKTPFAQTAADYTAGWHTYQPEAAGVEIPAGVYPVRHGFEVPRRQAASGRVGGLDQQSMG